MPLETILIIILVLAVIGAAPWPNSHAYGFWPSGIAGLVLVILIVYLLLR